MADREHREREDLNECWCDCGCREQRDSPRAIRCRGCRIACPALESKEPACGNRPDQQCLWVDQHCPTHMLPKEEGEAPLYAPGEAKNAAKTQARIEARRTAKERIAPDPFLTTAASKETCPEYADGHRFRMGQGGKCRCGAAHDPAQTTPTTPETGAKRTIMHKASHVSEHGTSIAQTAAIDHTKLVSGQHDSLASGHEPTLASQCACCGWGGPGRWEYCHNCTKAMRNERNDAVLYLEQRGYMELAEAIYQGDHKP